MGNYTSSAADQKTSNSGNPERLDATTTGGFLSIAAVGLQGLPVALYYEGRVARASKSIGLYVSKFRSGVFTEVLGRPRLVLVRDLDTGVTVEGKPWYRRDGYIFIRLPKWVLQVMPLHSTRRLLIIRLL